MIYFKISAKNIIIYAFCNKLSFFVYNVTYYENGGMWMSIEQEVLSKNEGRKKGKKKFLRPSILDTAIANREKNLILGEALITMEKTKAYDHICKLVLSNKPVVARIMKRVMKVCKNMTVDEIVNCIENDPQVIAIMKDHDQIIGLNVEDECIIGAPIRYDVLFKAKLPTADGGTECVGIFMNFEIQIDDNPGYSLVTRGIYYTCRILARQKNATDGFVNSNFNDIQKVYSIWICPVHKKEKDDVINIYHIKEECLKNEWHWPQKDYDLMELIMLYPGTQYDYDQGEEHGLLEMLNILFTMKISAEEKKRLLEKNYGIIMTKNMDKEVEYMCNLSEGILKQGLEQGIEIGKAQGIQEGELISAIKLTKNLIKSSKIDVYKAMALLDLPQDIRKIVIEEINKED